MTKRNDGYKKANTQEVQQILANVAAMIQEYGNIDQYQHHLFWHFGDAYERGYCGPLYYRQYEDSLRREWIDSKPSISGDMIVAYAVNKGIIRHPASDGDTNDITAHDSNGYWWLQFDKARRLWDAWNYAWRRLRYRHRCYRRYPDDPIPAHRQAAPPGEPTFRVDGHRCRCWED